ncbi:hypothetical protein EMIT0P395_100173 [Pseudomonas sp. IT-P395]
MILLRSHNCSTNKTIPDLHASSLFKLIHTAIGAAKFKQMKQSIN